MPAFGKVTGLFSTFVVDGVDENDFPDLMNLIGTVTFTPDVAKVIDSSNSPIRALGASPITGVVVNGILSTPVKDGPAKPGIFLVANNDPSQNPYNTNYKVTYNLTTPESDGKRAVPFDGHLLAVPAGGEVSLVGIMPPANAPAITVAAATSAAAQAAESLRQSVRSINGVKPDSNGNVVVSGGGEGGTTPVPGADGREVRLQATSTYIQWQYEGDATWANLIAIVDLKGAKGNDGTSIKGDPGNDGRSVELRVTSTEIQWRLIGSTAWTSLITLDLLKGAKGDKGDSIKGDTGATLELQVTATEVQWRPVGTTTWYTLVALSAITGPKGNPGNDSTVAGPPGKSAYQVWIDAGNTGDINAYLAAIKGAKGDAGASVKGDKGDTGLSAYQFWLTQGNTGTEAQYLAAIKGAKGDAGASVKGDTGATGPQGIPGGFVLLPANVNATPTTTPVGTLVGFRSATA